jgi:integrase
VLRAPGSITKNGRGRSIGLAGETRAIMERRLQVRRLDTTLIFHRTSKGKAGQPVKDIRLMWDAALKAAGLPEGRIFHDLRRSAVRNLIRAGVDPSVAMKVSGHRTRSMLDRYNVIEDAETAAALAQVDTYLSTQPKARNVEVAQFGHSGQAVGAEVSPLQQELAEAGRNRIQEPYRARIAP